MIENIVQFFKQEEEVEEEREKEKKKEEELDGLSFELPFHLLSLNEEELDGSCSEFSLDVFREKEKEEVLERPWSELPFHLLCLFSAPLILRDLDTFRAICKSWRLSSPMSPLRPLLDPPYSRSPCLMSSVKQKCIFFHPMHDNVIYQMDTPELWGATIRCSKYGWLLLSRKNGSVFFFHPFDRIKIELPSYSNWKRCESMSFSSPPTSIDCFVIGIILYGEKFIIIRRGEVTWTLCEFTDYFRPFNDSNPLLYKGRCYWLGVRGYDLPAEVGIFDPHEYLSHPNQYKYRWKYLPPIIPPKHLDNSLKNSYLLESDGKLFAVFELHEIEPSIQIYSVNLSFGPRMEWHKVTNIENKMLYVSSGGSFSELAVAKDMSNKIYLPNVLDNNSIFYSLETNKYHSCFSDYSSRNTSLGKELTNCTWIIPSCIDLDVGFKW